MKKACRSRYQRPERPSAAALGFRLHQPCPKLGNACMDLRTVGDDGFLLQRLSGPCTASVELGGEVVTYDLAPGETLQVHPGHIGMFQDSVNFDIAFMRGCVTCSATVERQGAGGMRSSAGIS